MATKDIFTWGNFFLKKQTTNTRGKLVVNTLPESLYIEGADDPGLLHLERTKQSRFSESTLSSRIGKKQMKI